MLLTLTPEGDLAWKEMRLMQVGDYLALGRGVHTWPVEDAVLPPWEQPRAMAMNAIIHSFRSG